MPTQVILGIGALILIVLGLTGAVMLFRAMWRVALPNQALIIAGPGRRGRAGPEFKIVTGAGLLVVPGIQLVRSLSLDIRRTELSVSAVTSQGIPVGVKGVVLFKVGDSPELVANAARRFVGDETRMEPQVRSVFNGRLRSIVGKMTIEEMIGDREMLNQQTREGAAEEMERLGLVVDSVQVQDIEDPSGYIRNLAAPHQATVQQKARVAQAEADRSATLREQEANAEKAQARRDAAVRMAGFEAETSQAQATAEQAGPLARAKARQAVLVQETEMAKLEAEREQQRLLATVVRPAEAQRQAAISRADGEAQAKRQLGDAEAHSLEAKGMADARIVKAHAEALAENQEAVINRMVAERLPEIVSAIAKPLAGVNQMVMLEGGQSLTRLFSQVLGQGATLMPVVRSILDANGKKVPGGQNGAPGLDGGQQEPPGDGDGPGPAGRQ